MRATEIITELFDSTTQWKLVKATNDDRVYSWTSGDVNYELKAEGNITTLGFWWIDFSATNPDIPSIGLTGTGNELQVFSTVIDIIVNDIIPATSPRWIAFSASLTDGLGKKIARADLYSRLVKKYLPANYEAEITDEGGSRIFNITKKKDYENT